MSIILRKKSRQKYNALVIRFRRRGCIKYAIFDIVLIKQSKRIKGRYIEKLGFFNPQFTERMFIINSARLAYWLNAGAHVKFSVKRHLVKFLV